MTAFLSTRRRFACRLLGAGFAASALLRVRSGLAADHPDPLYQASFADVQGKARPLSAFLGRPLVVNFWATWCPPCVHEMPDLQALSEQHPQAGFVGLAVDTAVNVRNFSTQKVRVSYPLLVVGFEGIELMRPLGNSTGGLPFTVVFNARGEIAERILGPVKPESLTQVLGRLAG